MSNEDRAFAVWRAALMIRDMDVWSVCRNLNSLFGVQSMADE